MDESNSKFPSLCYIIFLLLWPITPPSFLPYPFLPSRLTMDALSTTSQVSSLRPKPFLLTNLTNQHHLHKPPPPSNTNNSLSTKPNSLSAAPKHLPAPSAQHLHSTRRPVVESTARSHCQAATGYAAALLDVAACDGVLGKAARDVRRFMRAVRTVLDKEVEEGAKGEAVKKVVEGGRFYGKLVVLVRMLVRKGKVGLVGEVMEEFGRLWVEMQLLGIPSSPWLVERGHAKHYMNIP